MCWKLNLSTGSAGGRGRCSVRRRKKQDVGQESVLGEEDVNGAIAEARASSCRLSKASWGSGRLVPVVALLQQTDLRPARGELDRGWRDPTWHTGHRSPPQIQVSTIACRTPSGWRAGPAVDIRPAGRRMCGEEQARR
eukprot:759825-Hanusia_phi.AAC.6